MKNNITQKNIPKDWFETTLEKECDILKGQGLSKGKLLENGEKECILYGELYTTYNEVIDVVKSRTDSEEGIRSKSGDILIPASTTTVAKDLAIATALNKDNVLLGGDINILRKKKNSYDPNFLAYYLTHYKNKELSSLAQGITIIHLYGKDFKQLNICIPKSVKEQQKIAGILGTVDENIEKTQEVINEIEKLKKGLAQILLKKGDKKKICDVAQLNPKQVNPLNHPNKEFCYIDIASIKEHTIIDTKKFYGKDAPSRARRVIENEDIVISTVRPNLKGYSYVTEKYNNFLCSTGFCVLRRNIDKIDSNFFYYIISDDRFTEYLVGKTTGSNYPAVNPIDIGDYVFCLPSIEEQRNIGIILSAVDEKISINKKLKAKLTLLKKGLMQDLLSGKVRIMNV